LAHRCPIEDFEVSTPSRGIDPEVLDEPQSSRLAPGLSAATVRSSVIDRSTPTCEPGEDDIEGRGPGAQRAPGNDDAYTCAEPQRNDHERSHGPVT
jgi:hypothetical protein